MSISTSEGFIQMARAGKSGVDDKWMVAFHREAQRELFACGLYCLGIEEEGVWRKLNVTLTAHEKMELRLSMPREFWPKNWFEEELAQGRGQSTPDYSVIQIGETLAVKLDVVISNIAPRDPTNFDPARLEQELLGIGFKKEPSGDLRSGTERFVLAGEVEGANNGNYTISLSRSIRMALDSCSADAQIKMNVLG